MLGFIGFLAFCGFVAWAWCMVAPVARAGDEIVRDVATRAVDGEE
jgi:hypothetical protein